VGVSTLRQQCLIACLALLLSTALTLRLDACLLAVLPMPPSPLPPLPAAAALQDLKAGLLEHAKTLSECKRYDSLMAYLLFALGVVDSMPHWEADSHNKASKELGRRTGTHM
jgi:hypothetical protein